MSSTFKKSPSKLTNKNIDINQLCVLEVLYHQASFYIMLSKRVINWGAVGELGFPYASMGFWAEKIYIYIFITFIRYELRHDQKSQFAKGLRKNLLFLSPGRFLTFLTWARLTTAGFYVYNACPVTAGKLQKFDGVEAWSPHHV